MQCYRHSGIVLNQLIQLLNRSNINIENINIKTLNIVGINAKAET